MPSRRSISVGPLFVVLLASIIGYVVFTTSVREAFSSPSQEVRDPQRCGVDLPPCLPQRGWEGVRCVNGWCRSDRP